MKHTRPLKPITLAEAMGRIKRLTQLQLEEASGVDRTRISKLLNDNDPRLLHDTYEKLDAALRALGALRATEKLVFRASEDALRADRRAGRDRRAAPRQDPERREGVTP